MRDSVYVFAFVYKVAYNLCVRFTECMIATSVCVREKDRDPTREYLMAFHTILL